MRASASGRRPLARRRASTGGQPAGGRRAARAGGDGPGKYDRGLSAAERDRAQRAAILVAAAEVFAERGYAQTVVAEVVAQAGVSKSSFYKHFDSLADCLVQLYDDSIERIFSGLAPALAGFRDPVDRLRATIAGYLAMTGQNAPLALVLNREMVGVGRSYVERRDASMRRYAKVLADGVREAVAQGIVSREPDAITSLALVGGIEVVAMSYVDRGQEARILEATEPLVELVLRAFR